jgi:phospholipase C
LQFLEKFASHKAGKSVQESNISEWRRTVCGDLTSVFQPPHEKLPSLPYPEKDAFIERIHKAKFKNLPWYQALTPDQIAESGGICKPLRGCRGRRPASVQRVPCP